MVVTPSDLPYLKTHATCKPHGSVFYRTGVLGERSLHFSNGNFLPFLLLWPWPWLPWRYTGFANMNFLCQGFLKVIVWQTDIQTDCYMWSLQVMWKRWRSHHWICHTWKTHATHRLAPKYLSDCFRSQWQIPTEVYWLSGLHSATAGSTLPSHLHVITWNDSKWKWLKNVLFDCAYNWLLLALSALQISRWLIDWSKIFRAELRPRFVMGLSVLLLLQNVFLCTLSLICLV